MRSILLALLLVVFGLSGFGQSFRNEFGFKTENDAYLATLNDRYYTNGLFIYFRRAIESSSHQLEKKIVEVSVGQEIYTPYWGQVPRKENQDRPFAGYLYAGGTYSQFTNEESVLKLGGEIGVVGPASLAQKAQEFLHRTVGFYPPAGWEYQIKNQLALNLSAGYDNLLLRTNDQAVDVIAQGTANLGTTFSGLSAGILFRAGRLNRLFNSASYHATIGDSKTGRLYTSEFFFYARPRLNYVAYDATIQGSILADDSPVTFGVKPLVFDQQFGINYSSKRFTIDFNAIFRTKEVKSKAKAQNYGGLSLYYRFGD